MGRTEFGEQRSYFRRWCEIPCCSFLNLKKELLKLVSLNDLTVTQILNAIS